MVPETMWKPHPKGWLLCDRDTDASSRFSLYGMVVWQDGAWHYTLFSGVAEQGTAETADAAKQKAVEALTDAHETCLLDDEIDDEWEEDTHLT